MGKEIERKFLVKDDSYKTMAESHRHISQGYLSTDPDRTVRVRTDGNEAWLTVKSRNQGAARGEWEYSIPFDDAMQLMKLCGGHIIVKTRYYVRCGRHVWEVDAFEENHRGLVVAEIELADENETFDKPPFIGAEVTGQVRYYNSVLAGLRN